MRVAIALLCVSVPSIAFADASDVATTHIARARLTSDAAPDAIQRAACGLDAHVEIAGAVRTLDVRVMNGTQVTRCASTNGLVLTVQTTDAHDLIAEVEVPDDAPQETSHELANLVQTIAIEIKRRASLEQPQAPVRKEAFSPALTVTGIVLGAAGIGMFVTGYVWLLGEIGNIECANSGRVCIDAGPPLLLAAGIAALPIGALLAVIGEHRVPIQVTPRAGGVTVGFSFRF